MVMFMSTSTLTDYVLLHFLQALRYSRESGGEGQRHYDLLGPWDGRLDRLPRHNLVDPLVTGDATVEAHRLAEVVIDRQLGQSNCFFFLVQLRIAK